MSERTAIVTLAIGDEIAARWHRVCEPNWRRYADRHGYDVICVTEPLDASERARERSPSWQKLLLPGQPFASNYDRLVWVDADVFFGDEAPAITDGVPPELVGAVDELAELTPEIERVLYQRPMDRYYRDFGLPHEHDEIVQAGVMVLSPRHHRDLFQHVYDAYEDQPGLFYEMRPLSWELLEAGLVSWLDPRFNAMWFVYRANHMRLLVGHPRHPRLPALAERALSDDVYCLHFAGEAKWMDFTLGGPPAGRQRRPVPPTRAPVALFMYRRPDTTAQVIDAVREARPSRLYAVANAPRPGVEGEAELCEATRALLETVDWPCDVSTHFAAEHLSLSERIESGLDWVFEQSEEAIVLEDDCVPDPTFFPYCDELLERYRDEESVMSISGDNFQFEEPASEDSYYFSFYSHTWGWATWRRAWNLHDPEMKAWPELRDRGWLEEILDEPSAVAYWSHVLERNHGDRDAWDRAWVLACWVHGGVHAVPNVNLVTNVGFREDATHTHPELGAVAADLPTEAIEFPLRHPDDLTPNLKADRYTDALLFGGNVREMLSRVRRVRKLREATA